jgi:phage terminase large subunit-like protein
VIALAEKLEVIRLHEEMERRKAGRKLQTYYPETGPLRRELYPKHLEFFRLGNLKPERLMLAANRVGKTESIGGYEVACHLTGQYPDWWPGVRLTKPWEWWAAGDTRETTRDIQQAVLLGKPGDPSALGTGLIPRDALIGTSPGFIPNAVSSVTVRHVNGWVNTLYFKSYDQGRKAFQGTKRCIWLDEEPPMDVYTECLLRTASTGDGPSGLLLATFTPLEGMSEVVTAFLDSEEKDGKDGPKVVVMAGWDDVPHMTEEEKKRLLSSTPPYQRDARSKGIPQLGAGAIYPVEESLFVIDPVPIQPHWRIAYGMDVGWNCTAAVWGAHDKDTDTVYLFREYAAGEQHPSVHAAALRGKEGSPKIPGVIDPASRGRSQRDGLQLIQDYCDLGLDLTPANNAVEAGLFETLTRMTTNRFKVFNTLVGWLKEFRVYQRDEKGRVIKKNDHRMDATRYLINSGLEVAKPAVPPKPKPDPLAPRYGLGAGSWMG